MRIVLLVSLLSTVAVVNSAMAIFYREVKHEDVVKKPSKKESGKRKSDKKDAPKKESHAMSGRRGEVRQAMDHNNRAKHLPQEGLGARLSAAERREKVDEAALKKDRKEITRLEKEEGSERRKVRHDQPAQVKGDRDRKHSIDDQHKPKRSETPESRRK